MLPVGNWLLVFLSTVSFLILISIAPEITASAVGYAEEEDDGNAMNKRGWKDVSGSWGKRGWNDLQGTWGKRAWEKLNGAWGKRLTLHPEPEEDVDDFPSEINKRPEWSKFKGSWGKRAGGTGGTNGWNNLKGVWGKRAWDKLSNSWGKRQEYGAEDLN